MMQLGISSYTFTWAVGVPEHLPARPLTPYDLIDKACELQVPVLQIADNLPLEELEPEEIIKIRDYAKSKGIAIEMGGKGLTIRHTLQCLHVAEQLGSPVLRMVIDDAKFQPKLPEVIAIINSLLTDFRRKNIRLAIENHDRFKAREFLEIVRKTDPALVGICLDSVNSMGAGEGFETVLEILAPCTINLHVKDFTIRRVNHKMGFVIEGCPAGKGMLNVAHLISAIKRQSNCNSAILELWTPPEENLQETIEKEEKWAVESISFLKSVITQ